MHLTRLGLDILREVICSCTIGIGRVEHGYTAGQVFPHSTHTRAHRNPLRVVPVPYRNSRSVKQNPQCLLYPWSPLCLLCSFLLICFSGVPTGNGELAKSEFS